MLMKHSSLVVLGLLADGSRHGYELEKQIRRRNIRLWAKIGASTIYKCLQDLERDGFLSSRAEAADRGAGRAVFSITEQGRTRLAELVVEALRSEGSVYSDRIVGMAFAHALDPPAAIVRLRGAHDGMDRGLARLDDARANTAHSTAQIIIDYYIEVMSAEQRALGRAAALLEQHASARQMS